jgi:hypothetical protein
MINKINAILSLCPDAIVTVSDEEVIWHDGIEKLTNAQINAEVIRLQAEYDLKQYQRNRAKTYPSIVDQLDILYHGGLDAWKETIDAVKNQYPKP